MWHATISVPYDLLFTYFLFLSSIYYCLPYSIYALNNTQTMVVIWYLGLHVIPMTMLLDKNDGVIIYVCILRNRSSGDFLQHLYQILPNSLQIQFSCENKVIKVTSLQNNIAFFGVILTCHLAGGCYTTSDSSVPRSNTVWNINMGSIILCTSI